MEPLFKETIMRREWFDKNPLKVLSLLGQIHEDAGLAFLKMPTLRQVQDFIYNHRRHVFKLELGKSQNKILNLLSNFEINAADTKSMFVIYKDLDPDRFLIVFSSMRLMQNYEEGMKVNKEPFIHIDTTYKISNVGLFLMIMGTEDPNHHFRFISLALTSKENTSAYSRFIKYTRESINSYFNITVKPSFVLSDGADSILAACQLEFGNEYCHLLCYFHLIQAIERQVKKKSVSPFSASIFWGIKCMKETATKEEFDELWSRIVKPYWSAKGIDEGFIAYFEKEYVNRGFRWHDGAAFDGKNRTNNSLEAFNNVIKQAYTHRTRHGFYQLVSILDRITRDYSTIMDQSFNAVCIEKKVWLDSEVLSRSKQVAFLETPGGSYGLFGRKNRPPGLTKERMDNYLAEKDLEILTMEDLYWYRKTLWVVDFGNFQCKCHKFISKSYCKHSLASKLHAGVVVSPHTSNIEAQHPKKGRPKEVGPALDKE